MLYQNLDVSDWKSDKVYHESLLSASLVEHVAGLHLDDIVNISAIDESARRLDETVKRRVLSTKRLELDITFHVRPQYFNRTDTVSVADAYSAVVSHMSTSSNDILSDLQASSGYFTSAILLSTTYSPYTSTIAHSSFPTSSPTSQPTCGTGSYQVGNGCGPCARGYYSDSLNEVQCTACPVETYSNSVGSVECSPCEARTTNIKVASTSCPHFTLNASAASYYTLCAFITALFLFSLYFAGENMYIMFALGLFPFLDIVSDLIYILSVKFWSVEILFFALFFFVVPSSVFVYKLVHMKVYPRLIKYAGVEIMNDKYIWLTVNSDGSPLINGERSTWSYEEHDGLEKLAWFWLLWIILVGLQSLFLLLGVVWYVLMAIFLLAWLVVGLFLYQTKMLAIGKVWNYWFYTWTQSNEFDKEINLDATVLNESLFYEFMLETVPQILIQSVNNSLIYNGRLPAISVFSIAMSVFIAINGIYRYGYYLLWKKIKFDEIPLPLAVRMQKINKSILPRRSMIARNLEAIVGSVRVRGSISTETNDEHVSEVTGDSKIETATNNDGDNKSVAIDVTKVISLQVRNPLIRGSSSRGSESFRKDATVRDSIGHYTYAADEYDVYGKKDDDTLTLTTENPIRLLATTKKLASISQVSQVSEETESVKS